MNLGNLPIVPQNARVYNQPIFHLDNQQINQFRPRQQFPRNNQVHNLLDPHQCNRQGDIPSHYFRFIDVH